MLRRTLLLLLLLAGCGGGGADSADVGLDVPTADTRPRPEDVRASPDSSPDSRVRPGTWPSVPAWLGGLDLLVITRPDLADALTPYVEWKRRKGLKALLVTTPEIYNNFTGRDPQEKIRNAIKAVYKKNDIKWVLLAGDTDSLPARRVYCEMYNSAEDFHAAEELATDLYFADLDGDWDGDGDNSFGERADQPDLQPDIAVGRISIRTTAQAEAWVDKVLAYERTPAGDYEDKALLLGEYAGDFMGEPICSTLALENSIALLLKKDFKLTKLYESECGDFPDAQDNTPGNIKAAFAAGHNLVVDFGHGWWNTLSKLDLDDLPGLSNKTRPSVYLTTECNACEFDLASPDQVACEAFTLSPGGGVLYIGNTDFGVGFPWEMTYYHEFLKQLLADPSITAGELFVSTTLTYADPAELLPEQSDLRWTQFTMILMGDPALHIRTSIPAACALTRVDDQTVKVTSGGVPFAGATVTSSEPGSHHLVRTSDADGLADFGTTITKAIATSPKLTPCELD